MTSRKPRRTTPTETRTEFPLVHLNTADLRFRLGVETAFNDMKHIWKKLPRTFRTPEYKAEFSDRLEVLTEEYHVELERRKADA